MVFTCNSSVWEGEAGEHEFKASLSSIVTSLGYITECTQKIPNSYFVSFGFLFTCNISSQVSSTKSPNGNLVMISFLYLSFFVLCLFFLTHLIEIRYYQIHDLVTVGFLNHFISVRVSLYHPVWLPVTWLKPSLNLSFQNSWNFEYPTPHLARTLLRVPGPFWLVLHSRLSSPCMILLFCYSFSIDIASISFLGILS